MQPQTQSQDFETRFFNLLERNLDHLREDMKSGFAETNRKIDENTDETKLVKEQAMRTNGRVTKLEKKVFTTPIWWQDKKLAYIAGACVLIFLLILATVLRVEIPSGLFP